MWDVVEEHLDEASFLWTQWEAGLASPRFTALELKDGLEERLLAHVDGLVIAGEEAAKRLLLPGLEEEDPGRVSAAAFALLAGESGLERLLAALPELAPTQLGAIGRALELSTQVDPLPLLKGPAKVLALRALGFRQAPAGEALRAFSSSDDPEVACAVLRAAQASGREGRGWVERWLGSAEAAVRDGAIEAGLVLGLRSAWTACREVASSHAPDTGRLLLLLALSGEPDAVELLEAALGVAELRPAALVALGYTGRVRAAELCLEQMREEESARVAAEAFSAITGLALKGELVRPEPEPDTLVPLEEEDLEADLVPGSEAQLPLPEPDAVARWWAGAKRQLEPDVRYLGGKPLSGEALKAAFEGGPMRRRHALGLELAIRTHGEYRVQTYGWARDQLRAQAQRRLPARVDFQAGFSQLMST
jgi:uncharacterized protein (TIGR02270 family)